MFARHVIRSGMSQAWKVGLVATCGLRSNAPGLQPWNWETKLQVVP